MGSKITAPLIALKRQEQRQKGQPKGTVATSPAEIDAIIRKTYGKIYAGNVMGQEQKTEEYMDKYSECLHKEKQANVEDITGEDLETTGRMTGDSAAGMDQWAPGALSMLYKEAYKILANMLNSIEKGSQWPEQVEKARAAFLAKDPDDALNPLSYRVWLMSPSTYRMWSKTRLRHLQPWIAQWTLGEMYAGVEGRVADDAAYSTAVLMEWRKAHGVEHTGGAADIYKCFDQILRPLLYRILKEAGVPERVLGAYRRFLEALQVHNTVAGGIGWGSIRESNEHPARRPHVHDVTTLLLRPWLMQMKGLGMQPRILADDLQIISTGTCHLERFDYAYSKAHEHFEDMGARIAPQKCTILFIQHHGKRVVANTSMEKARKNSACGKRQPRLGSTAECHYKHERRHIVRQDEGHN